MYKPSKTMLDLNLSEIERYSQTIKILRHCFNKGFISNKGFMSCKHGLSLKLSELNSQRLKLLKDYHEKLNEYHNLKRAQLVIDAAKQKEQFQTLVENMSTEERKLLKKFWHLV